MLTKAREIVVERRSVPVPGAKDVLVRVAAVGICGSDVHYYEEGRSGDYIVEQPLVLGHEASGIVIAVGDDVTALRTGQRVSIEPGTPCRTCRYCQIGAYNMCLSMRFHATPPIDGSFAEYVVVHESVAHPVPDSVSDEEAALLEPLSVGIWAARKAEIAPGDRVLINGAGPIGVIAAQVAREFGASDVVIVDVNEFRLELAQRVGIDTTILAGGDEAQALPPTFDVLIECSGNAAATHWAIGRMANLGRVVLVGVGGSDLVIPLGTVQSRELAIDGVFRYANTWPTAIDLVSRGRISLAPLITGRFTLDEVDTALNEGRNNPHSMKPVVYPGEPSDPTKGDQS
ncbi:NAD(P)-dependent alcohol dehydrogenase [Herbiconiux sp. UC225_62]|uniref:NAD(P)-dependent alcohol dehydrogenase n=1 Tax=Herbiconiux sp. UC225_62 TaxID=3350168 RepID=UPI0036D28BE7